MHPSRWLIATLLLLASLAAHAEPNAYSTRLQAIKGLTAPDAAHRVDAVVWLAANGTAADEKLLRRASPTTTRWCASWPSAACGSYGDARVTPRWTR